MNLVSFSYSGQALADCMRAKIYRLEAELLERPQVDCPVRHIFRPGEYEREMTIPPMTVISGAVHTTEHLVKLVKGTIEVLTDDGIKVLRAPCEFISKPGMKRVGRTFDEEVIWSTVHENPDECRDLDVIVARISTSKNSELLGNRPALKNEVQKCLLG